MHDAAGSIIVDQQSVKEAQFCINVRVGNAGHCTSVIPTSCDGWQLYVLIYAQNVNNIIMLPIIITGQHKLFCFHQYVIKMCNCAEGFIPSDEWDKHAESAVMMRMFTP